MLAVGLPTAVFLANTGVEFLLLVTPLLLLILVELLNSAIESVVDRVEQEHHELAGRAKDMGSAAVFVCLVLLGVSWLVILYPRWQGLLP